MSGVTALHSEGTKARAEVSLRPFKTQLHPRFKRLKEAGELPEGSVWEVRIIEAGQSLNGPIYLADALKEAAPIFEGAPVYLYSFDGEPTSKDAEHLPDDVASEFPAGLVGNQVGSLEGVHWNEEAQALDGLLKVYDGKTRERLVAAHKLGDIGEGGERDVFGLSIDAIGDTNTEGEVTKLKSANSVDLVSSPAAGGRIRRLVAAMGAKATTSAGPELPELEEEVDGELGEALTHNSTLEEGEPPWGNVSKTELPDQAFATIDFAPDQRSFPHHWVKGGTVDPETNRYTTGDLFLHQGGLNAAWAAAQGARTGKKADPRIISHLQKHREALGLEEGTEEDNPMGLTEAVTKRLTEAATELEEKARLKMLLEEAGSQLDKLRWDRDEMTTQDKVGLVKGLASDLATALSSPEVMAEAHVREAAGTLAGKLKVWADQLSAATDEEAPKIIEAIRDELTKELGGEGAAEQEPEEGDDMAKEKNQGAAPAAEDEFARMSAGLEEVIKRPDLPGTLKEALVGLLGREPDEDERDATIRNLRESIRDQAISFAFGRLCEEMKKKDGTEIVDPELVLTLMDRTAIKVSEQNQVEGLKEAVEAVLEAKPYLRLKEATPPPAAAGTPPAAPPAAPPANPPKEGTPLTEAEKEAAKKKADGSDDDPGIRLRESVRVNGGKIPKNVARRLAFLQKQMRAGDVDAMHEHRKLRQALQAAV